MGNQFDIEEIKNMVSNIGTTLIGTDSVINPYTMGPTQQDNNNEDIKTDIYGIYQRVNDIQAHLTGLESNINYSLSKILERLDVISRAPSVIAFLALDKIRDYIDAYDEDGVISSEGLITAIETIKGVLNGQNRNDNDR